jgi:predicted RNA binding protein YcfA (HicA-like mRNA interferase family)
MLPGHVQYARLKTLTARRLVSALRRDGFTLDRQSGAHRHYMHPDGRRVTVSFHHPGQTFAPKTLKAMIELQAGWSLDDLRRLGLLK